MKPLKDELGVAHLEGVYAIFRNPSLYTLGDDLQSLLSADRVAAGGRPAEYPAYMTIAFNAIASVYGSARSAATQLAGPTVWEEIRKIVKAAWPDDKAKWLSEKPMSRHCYIKRRNRIDSEILEGLRARFVEMQVALAVQLGYLSGTRGSTSHPNKTDTIHADGKVVEAIFKGVEGETLKVESVDRLTGEIVTEYRQVRFDPDVKVHETGDKRQVVGNKIWHAEVKGHDTNDVIVLDCRKVPGVKGEQNSEDAVALRGLSDIFDLAPGAVAAVTDTILRGVHLNKLQRQHGAITMAPVAAESVDKKTKKRTEKSTFLRTVDFHYSDSDSESVRIFTNGGWLAQEVVDTSGEAKLVNLNRKASPIRQNADGTYRTYVIYEVPDPREILPPQQIMERTYTTSEDVSRGFNRSENIHQIPTGDPDYLRLYGPTRNDSEGLNRRLDDHLPLRRARSIGADRQLFDALCHFFFVNSVTLARHLKREGQAEQAA